jgi:hypothetical protein
VILSLFILGLQKLRSAKVPIKKFKKLYRNIHALFEAFLPQKAHEYYGKAF